MATGAVGGLVIGFSLLCRLANLYVAVVGTCEDTESMQRRIHEWLWKWIRDYA